MRWLQTSPIGSWQSDFWGEVGKLAEQSMDLDRATWCNTHGHAVPWLHVRFDPTHKYPAFPPHGAITAASQSGWYERWYEPVFGVSSERADR